MFKVFCKYYCLYFSDSKLKHREVMDLGCKCKTLAPLSKFLSNASLTD